MSAKVTPESVNLRMARPSAARRCANCSMHRKSSLSCTHVFAPDTGPLPHGQITDDETCDDWAPEDS